MKLSKFPNEFQLKYILFNIKCKCSFQVFRFQCWREQGPQGGRQHATVSCGQVLCRSPLQGEQCSHLLLPERGHLRAQHGDLHQVSGGRFGYVLGKLGSSSYSSSSDVVVRSPYHHLTALKDSLTSMAHVPLVFLFFIIIFVLVKSLAYGFLSMPFFLRSYFVLFFMHQTKSVLMDGLKKIM